jgi:hypothetical protein
VTPTPTPTEAPETVIQGSKEDTWVGPSNPAANHGSETLIHIDGNASARERSLIAFNANSGVPSNASILSATLTVCMQNIVSAAVGRTHGVYRITADWDEMTATWNNVPTFNATASSTITVPLVAQCVDFDVTADVQSWTDGASNYGWMLKDATEVGGLTGVEYASKEHATQSQRPRLTITFTD